MGWSKGCIHSILGLSKLEFEGIRGAWGGRVRGGGIIGIRTDVEGTSLISSKVAYSSKISSERFFDESKLFLSAKTGLVFKALLDFKALSRPKEHKKPFLSH